VAVCDIIRERLLTMRIDPEVAVALWRGEEAAAELAGMPDTQELCASEAPVTEPDLSEARDQMYTAITRIVDIMMARFDRGEEPIKLGTGSLAELFAFVSAFGPPQGQDRSLVVIA
jgi:hypothetical protein